MGSRNTSSGTRGPTMEGKMNLRMLRVFALVALLSIPTSSVLPLEWRTTTHRTRRDTSSPQFGTRLGTWEQTLRAVPITKCGIALGVCLTGCGIAQFADHEALLDPCVEGCCAAAPSAAKNCVICQAVG